MADNDYTGSYNTRLSPESELAFLAWIDQISRKRGKNAMADLYDYDMRGAFKGGMNALAGHMPDTFKKPNHPTFSNESIYSAGPTMTGGRWSQTPGPVAVDVFTASPFNQKMWSLSDLAEYFKHAEPNAMLNYGR